ncbi:MAG: DNA repair exonuclease [Oscillospiraceae bacterium]|nr:DNA repair exonuclease [Oscillospiraceae bacterium]
MSVKIVHAADFHLDSAFGALSSERARQRRRESRDLVERLSNYVNQQGADIVLLAGDLFDAETTYRETIEQLPRALAEMSAEVFIAPGNHDFFHARSPYATLAWSENVHIFTKSEMESVTLPRLGCAVYGAAFTSAAQEESLLKGFSAPDDGLIHIGVLHGDLAAAEARYCPLAADDIAASNLDYLALGHTHAFSGVKTAGKTAYAYSGCIEGRGFDETGDKGFLAGTVDRGSAQLHFVPFARRRYEILNVDVTEKEVETALREALPESTASDLYRIVFTGETGESGVDTERILERFGADFYHLEVRDKTRLREDIWARAGEDSLRGLFLRDLRAKYDAADAEERETIVRAVRFGLAALDGRDM